MLCLCSALLSWLTILARLRGGPTMLSEYGLLYSVDMDMLHGKVENHCKAAPWEEDTSYKL